MESCMFRKQRKIPLNYASRYTTEAGGLQKSAYLPFKVNSAGVMPIKEKDLSSHTNSIAFFNYYYTFLQLDPDDVSEQLKRQGASIPLVWPGSCCWSCCSRTDHSLDSIQRICRNFCSDSCWVCDRFCKKGSS